LTGVKSGAEKRGRERVQADNTAEEDSMAPLRVALLAALPALSLVGCTLEKSSSPRPQFAGSEACAGCHQAQYTSWKETYHSKMVRTRQEGLLRESGEYWAKDAKGNPGPTKGNIDGKPYGLEDVQYVIGSKWKQRFVVKNPATGNHQFLDKQMNRSTGLWEPYGQRNDWETQCATCHSTGYRIEQANEKGAVLRASMVERNVGCEACHGPAAAHAAAPSKANVFNPANASKADSSKVCGYCHIRVENNKWLTAQGNHAEHVPHPVKGETYKAGQDDWTKWYPAELLAPGIHMEDSYTAENKGTDLFNAFWVDEQGKTSGLYDARKHHQEYQEYIQSKHYKANLLSCADCHSVHSAPAKPAKDARATCAGCHGGQYDVERIMPGTASTAGNLFVRTHTFNKDQARKPAPTADKLPPPQYFYKR
jgi:nitrate/TMAO reductase-like tetraheme cytochrome c subunit